MNKILILFLLSSQAAFAQHRFIARITGDDTHRPLGGVTVSIPELHTGSISNDSGIAIIPQIPDGNHEIFFSSLGYEKREIALEFPRPGNDTLNISLEPSGKELQNIVVSTTRLNQLISNSPVHVDVIGKDDIEEGTAMSPGNIRELLTELSGTQVQQTSAVSGNVTIRLQGLDGRYTQLLKDGFPLYGGFSGSLNILQTPPLDLRQVEIIKGAGSALYGGDAIAGIINLISKTPDTALQVEGIINQTIKGGTDFSGFYSKRNEKAGLTLLATTSRQQPRDVNGDGFSDIPRVRQLTINPTLFWYPDDSSTVWLGVNISTENRAGGDMQAILNGADSLHSFLETNHTDRDYYQLSFTRKMARQTTFSFKNSVGYFYRSILGNAQFFSGTQISSFTEASLVFNHAIHQDVAGIDYVTDKFNPAQVNSPLSLGYANKTAGLFLQDDWVLSRKTTLETGIRTDIHNQVFALPRAAFLYKMLPRLTVRAGAGMGYKLPAVFNASSEEDAYNKVYPVTPSIKAERSESANLALNYHGHIGEDISLQVDQNFYYTRLSHALIPDEDSLAKGWLYYTNAPEPVISKGFETNAALSMEEWSLNLSYTYTDARKTYLAGNPPLPLVPRNKLVASLLYEKENNFKAGVEAFYTGLQYLDDGSQAPDFWTFDFMAEKTIHHFSILLNLENFTDTRQSRFGPLYSGTIRHPIFNEIYAPLDGFVGNLSLKFEW